MSQRPTKSSKSSKLDREEEQEEENEALIKSPPTYTPPSFSQKALSQALASTAHLANLLPTGTLLAFQLLTPVFTNNGSCDSVTYIATKVLLLLLAASAFLACFTDSFRSQQDGQVYYGLATRRGMWLFDYPVSTSTSTGTSAAASISSSSSGPALPDLSKYRLRFLDYLHGVLSVMVFVSVAARDRNVVSCFWPVPEHETQEVLDIVPLGVGMLCSLLFVVFPTRRHGIGYPVTDHANSSSQEDHSF